MNYKLKKLLLMLEKGDVLSKDDVMQNIAKDIMDNYRNKTLTQENKDTIKRWTAVL